MAATGDDPSGYSVPADSRKLSGPRSWPFERQFHSHICTAACCLVIGQYSHSILFS